MEQKRESGADGEEVKLTAVRLALDELPAGVSPTLGKNVPLPQGVTGAMLDRDILRIGWPSLVELILTQLASMVDMMMVGQLGDWAITSVGLCLQPKFLCMVSFMALQTGATAVIARYKGAGERDRARAILPMTMLVVLLLSTVCAALCYIFAEPLVVAMGSTETITTLAAADYLRIQMLGLPGLALSTTITAALRGVGDSRTAMMYNFIANASNVVFNYMFIFGNWGCPRLEVAGASLATIMGQFLALAMAFFAVTRKRRYIQLSLRGFRMDWGEMGKVLHVGLPSMAEQFLLRLGIIVTTRTVASLGTTGYATYQVCMNILSLSFVMGQAFAVSSVSLVGQSLGRGRPDMAQHYAMRTKRIGIIAAMGLAVCFAAFRTQIILLYTDVPEIISAGSVYMLVIALIQPIQAQQLIDSGSLRGAGDTVSVAVITASTAMLLRPLLTIAAIRWLHIGGIGAWLALLVEQSLRTVLVALRFRTGKWKEIVI